MNLTDLKALTVDRYGTLIDWETGMISGSKPLTEGFGATMAAPDMPETRFNSMADLVDAHRRESAG